MVSVIASNAFFAMQYTQSSRLWHCTIQSWLPVSHNKFFVVSHYSQQSGASVMHMSNMVQVEAGAVLTPAGSIHAPIRRSACPAVSCHKLLLPLRLLLLPVWLLLHLLLQLIASFSITKSSALIASSSANSG